MNIDNLTLRELKQIASLFSSQNQPPPKQHPLIGMYCIARASGAGVHAGIVESVEGETVLLKDSRRLWMWKAAGGIALSGVAQNGLAKTGNKIDTLNPLILINGVCELIPCSTIAKESINDA